jgi:hypothetical protein
MGNYLKILLLTVSLCGGTVFAQIPVEVFTGTDKATLDIMFFKFFKNSKNEPSRFLFFNRNRLAVDYKMTSTENLPQFGFTEAVSYNHEKLKGLAPVFVAQVFNSGVYPKAGIQYVFINEKLTLFSWLVSETAKEPFIDYYILFRFSPAISDKLKLFTQFESLNTLQTATGIYQFTQRFRLGLGINHFQFGLGADLAEKGKGAFDSTVNPGIFLRYVF